MHNATDPSTGAPSKHPLVSVIIPTCNRPDMLAEAIASIQAQTCTDIEIIVVVNGPATDAAERSFRLASESGCRALRIGRQGIAAALNAGIASATGEFVAFCDDDDRWRPDKLEKQIAAARHRGADLVFCDLVNFGYGPRVNFPDRLVPIPGMTAAESLMLKNCGGGCSVTMARRSKVIEAGEFCERLVSPDWDLWIRLSWICEVAWIDEPLVEYRNHAGNASNWIPWTWSDIHVRSRAFINCPAHLRHMRRRMLRRAAWHLPLMKPYAVINRMTGGYLSYLKREVAGWR